MSRLLVAGREISGDEEAVGEDGDEGGDVGCALSCKVEVLGDEGEADVGGCRNDLLVMSGDTVVGAGISQERAKQRFLLLLTVVGVELLDTLRELLKVLKAGWGKIIEPSCGRSDGTGNAAVARGMLGREMGAEMRGGGAEIIGGELIDAVGNSWSSKVLVVLVKRVAGMVRSE